ncbi:tpr domain protein [Colletotrichum karsti]|uniref:Tpr domain protein n=1 Tax=Colletotrichum karsti TaxID=1095194 RepID=A0A9P6LFH3_9PEZI|nr:tpr domain protein [Colletotrichum karsti]KAF9870570.1 tpr domain protein [Colletotrichum karsti]
MDVKDASGSSEMESFFRNLMTAAEKASRRKGEIPRDHPPAGLLVTQFIMKLSMKQIKENDGHQLITTQVPPPYPPCLRPANSLKHFPISKMKLEEHHRGKQVLVRTMTPPDRWNSILAIVEDQEGTGTLLQLYNQPDETLVKAEDILPQNSVCLVKEPFFKATTSGGYSLRVDHIGDILVLHPDDQRIPRMWRSYRKTGTNSEEIRSQGNAAVAQQNWGKAERLYSDAISSATTPAQEQTALLNRSLANLRLQRPEKALSDALRARGGSVPTEKGLFREAKAHYALEQFSLCLEKLQQLVELNPANKDAKMEVERVHRRLREEAGEYQWAQMYRQAKATPPLIDCATFSSPVEVRASPGRGNGLFATKAVKAGDLLLCEKAFAYSYAGDDDPIGRQNSRILMNMTTKRMNKLQHNPQIASRFTELYRGDYGSTKNSQTDEIPVDTFLVEKIISLNCFGAPRSSLKSFETPEKESAFHTCGIWTMASHINHSCVGNCRRSFIGDMMILRAAQDLEPDTELLFCYQLPHKDDDRAATQKRLQSWGFICECELCLDKKSTSQQAFQKRQGLLQQLYSVMKTCRTPLQESKAQRFLTQLESCYPSREGAVRLELWDSYFGLGQKEIERGNAVEGLDLTIKGFQALGYIFAISMPGKGGKKAKLEVKKWGQINDYTVVGFLGLFHAYKSIAPELCEVVKGYARVAYTIHVGESETAGNLYEDLR